MTGTIETVENIEEIVLEPGFGFLFFGLTDLIKTLGVLTETGRLSVYGSE